MENKLQTVYVPVNVDERTPSLNHPNLIIQATHVLSNSLDIQLREGRFKSDYMDGSDPYFSVGKRAGDALFKHDEVTHWLEPQQAILLTKEDAEKNLPLLQELKRLNVTGSDLLGWLVSDSVQRLLRYGVKSPSSSGMDETDDNYSDLYDFVFKLKS